MISLLTQRTHVLVLRLFFLHFYFAHTFPLFSSFVIFIAPICALLFSLLSGAPTNIPTQSPTISLSPTNSPTYSPSQAPTISLSPTNSPTYSPSQSPTISLSPTNSPTQSPTIILSPTRSPTYSPTSLPIMRITPLPTSVNIRIEATSDGGPKHNKIDFLRLLLLVVPISAAVYLY